MSDNYLKIFFDALKSVKKQYLVYEIEDMRRDEEAEKQYEEHVERVFAYELYRQWANRLGDDTEYILNAEIGKNHVHCVEGYNKPYDEEDHWSNYIGTESIYPDLVLHKGQGKSGHKIVCEIKRGKSLDSKKILTDLKKLMYMTNKNFFSKLPYEYGILVIFNATTLKDIFDWEEIIQYQSDETLQLDRVLVATCSYENEKSIIEYGTLKDLCNNRENAVKKY